MVSRFSARFPAVKDSPLDTGIAGPSLLSCQLDELCARLLAMLVIARIRDQSRFLHFWH